MSSDYGNNDLIKRYLGYYLFDALGVKNNDVWYYILALFDVEYNTIVNYEIVESEDSETIFYFFI